MSARRRVHEAMYPEHYEPRRAPVAAANIHPDTPPCAFCWPTWTVSELIEPASKLPCCKHCNGIPDKAPGVPSFLWPELRLAARSVFDGVPA